MTPDDPLTGLPPFDELAVCAKCGSQDVNAYYHPDTHSGSTTCPVYMWGSHLDRTCCTAEHIDRRCRRCGFTWAEQSLPSAEAGDTDA
jgi:hypothetical protein